MHWSKIHETHVERCHHYNIWRLSTVKYNFAANSLCLSIRPVRVHQPRRENFKFGGNIFSCAYSGSTIFRQKDQSYSGTLLLINANSLGSSRQSGCPTRRAVYSDGYLRRRSSLLYSCELNRWSKNKQINK